MTFLTTSGVLDPSTDLYISRTADLELRENLGNGRSTLVVGSRCMGKTSLANFVGQWLELGRRPDDPDAVPDEGRYRMAFVDFDAAEVANADGRTTSERTARIVEATWSSLESRGYDAGPRPDPETTLREGLLGLARRDPDRPLLVVFDEFDRLASVGAQGAEIVHTIRGLLQELKREPALRELLSLCILSVRGAPELFEVMVTDPGAGLELPARQIDLGPFEIADDTTERLASAFAAHDPLNANNMALKLLEVSGGYPQLCMDLALRTIEERYQYANAPDYERFLLAQVVWMRTKADPIRRRFFDVFEGFISEDPALGAAALRVYRQALVALQHATPEVEYRNSSRAQRLLVVSGLLREVDGGLRVYSPFLASFFDLLWADDLRNTLTERMNAVREAGSPVDRSSGRISDRKLAVLVTGGTIGMVERDGLVRAPDTAAELEAEYVEVSELFDVTWYPLASLDSSNVGPAEWSMWSREIADRVADYDGIVVAHGTDTLAFTASAVAYALGSKLDIPVVFTGSQTTVDTVYGDARTNLIRACMVAAAPRIPSDLPEVVVAFGENVFRAVRAIKRDDRRFDAFESPAYPALGIISEDVTLYSHLIRRVPDLVPGVRTRLDVRDQFAPGVMVVAQVPGALADYYMAALERPDDRRPRGIVIQSLGAGNIPTAEGTQSLVPFIYEACRQEIPVLLAGQYPIYPANMGKYGPPRRAIAAGAIPIANMTTAALVSKLSWVLANLGNTPSDRLIDAVRREMLTTIVGEIDAQDVQALGQIDLAEIQASDGID